MMTGELSAAWELGRTCALATECARDLRGLAVTYGELLPARPFDEGFFTSIALVGAFGSPWAGAGQLRMVNRAAVWVFAVDRLIDHVATSMEEVDAIVGRCLATAGGAEPVDDLTRFLAGLAGELAGGSAWSVTRPLWCEQLERMLSAMAVEWRWHESGARPSFEEYLANADSCGSSFVNLSHWIHTGDPWTLGGLPGLRAVGDDVQRYLRLLNDLATYRRDVEWGDLNVLMLGTDREWVTEYMAALAHRTAELLAPVREASPRTALYLERQIGYNTGFYGLSDYWGEL